MWQTKSRIVLIWGYILEKVIEVMLETIFIEIPLVKLLSWLWARLRKGTHVRRYIFTMFGESILLSIFGYLLRDVLGISSRMILGKEIPEICPGDLTEEREALIRGFLKLHKRYHELKRVELCAVCGGITAIREYLERYVKDETLYPPFK